MKEEIKKEKCENCGQECACFTREGECLLMTYKCCIHGEKECVDKAPKCETSTTMWRHTAQIAIEPS